MEPGGNQEEVVRSNTVSIIKEIPEDYLDTITQVSRDDEQFGPNQ